MLVLFCFQVVQTNNSESSWREREKTTFYCKQTKDVQKILIKKM